jgi:hypothetical protein
MLLYTASSALDAGNALRTYASSLAHLLAHADKLKGKALAKKGETKKKRQVGLSVKRAAEPELLFSRTNTRLTNLPSRFERGSAAGELPIAYFPPRFDSSHKALDSSGK